MGACRIIAGLRGGAEIGPQEKSLARQLFGLKVRKADGNEFERLFSQILSFKFTDFRQIKPQGQLGDRKNDGYIPSSGTYFQVYAPEEPSSKVSTAVKKAKTDLDGLFSHGWNDIAVVKEFFFVYNNKYLGFFPEIEAVLSELKKKHSLSVCEAFSAQQLEDMLFELDDDQIYSVVGFLPNHNQIPNLDFEVLTEVVNHLMDVPARKDLVSTLVAPDFDKKLVFNGISKGLSMLISADYLSLHFIEDFFKLNSNFAKQALRDKVNGLYLSGKVDFQGDDLYNYVLSEAMPDSGAGTKAEQDACRVILAYFFESCDIFEDPGCVNP